MSDDASKSGVEFKHPMRGLRRQIATKVNDEAS